MTLTLGCHLSIPQRGNSLWDPKVSLWGLVYSNKATAEAPWWGGVGGRGGPFLGIVYPSALLS